MRFWDEIYMDWNGEKIQWELPMDEEDHKVFIFEKKVEEDITISPRIVKELNGKKTTLKKIQELNLKKWDTLKYEFKIHLVAE